jgi:hypothetical protein
MRNKRNGVKDLAETSRNTLDDVKMGAKRGAARGAAIGALGALGARAATVLQSANAPSAGDIAGQAGKKVKDGGKAPATMLQTLSELAGEALQSAPTIAPHVSIDPNDVPRLMRGLALVATGLGTLFAPGSSLDVSRMDGGEREMAEQARKGIDTVTELTQQRMKEFVDLARESLASLSDVLKESISTTEGKAQEALDVTEERLMQATEEVAGRTKEALPDEQKNGGSMRWLLLGLLAGGTVAYLSSPLSGQLGDQIQAMRRNFGLGGTSEGENEAWPAPPAASQENQSASGAAMDTPTSGSQTDNNNSKKSQQAS